MRRKSIDIFLLAGLFVSALGCDGGSGGPSGRQSSSAAGGADQTAGSGTEGAHQATKREDEADGVVMDSDAADVLKSLPYAGHDTDPSDENGVVVHDAVRSYPGYNLYTILWGSRAELIDEKGKVVKAWSISPSRTWAHSRLLPNGDLLVTGTREPSGPVATSDDEERYVLRMNWKGEKLWESPVNSHHDVVETPAGEIMTLAFRDRPIPALFEKGTVRDDDLVVLEASNGKELERASLYDVLAKKGEMFRFQPMRRANGDVFHSNSIFWIRQPGLEGQHPIYETGNILISSRNQDQIFVVNWPRKELIWTWGLGELDGQHDAQVLENGNILMFDNGIVRRQWSRVIEMDPRTGKIVWEYRGEPKTKFFSRSRGSAQRLPNGNTLIANSDSGEAFEVTVKGEVVWRFLCPHRNPQGKQGEKHWRATIVRMIRYPKEMIEGLLK